MRGASPSGEAAWRGFARRAVGCAAALGLGYLALAFLVDPYDTGRSPLSGAPWIRAQGPRTAAASRGRDPAFAAAIVGNSHAQLLSPERLAALTGLAFVQLSVPATGPGEQLLLAEWFLRHHPAARALVLAPDPYWCGDDPALRPGVAFPDWLFSRSTPRYLAGLLRESAAEEVAARLARRGPRARADGYWDYEPDYLRGGDPGAPARVAARERPAPEGPDPGRAGPAFPAASRLADLLRAAPEGLAVVLFLPPIHPAGLPRPGTPRAAAEAACKAALARAASARPRTALLDWRRPLPELGAADAFLDQSHYRHPVARRAEAAIAEVLSRLR